MLALYAHALLNRSHSLYFMNISIHSKVLTNERFSGIKTEICNKTMSNGAVKIVIIIMIDNSGENVLFKNYKREIKA